MSLFDYQIDAVKNMPNWDPNKEPPSNEKTHIILLGNGFDLSHGLKTTYRDYINWLGHQLEKDGFENYFNAPSDSDKIVARERLAEYLETGEFVDIDQVKSRVPLNSILVKFLKYGSANWFDIEKFYFKSLVKLSALKEVEELNSFFTHLQKDLEIYLREINSTVNSGIRSNAYDRIFRGMSNRYGKVVLVNFNYTKTANLYLDNDIDVIHIHGEVGNPSNPIVFGYGDEYGKEFYEIEERDIDEYLRFFKTNLYHFGNSYSKLQAELANDFDISIIGHSCGLSDRTLLRSIVNSSNCWKIHLYHHKGQDSFRETVLRLYRHFPDKQIARDSIQPYNEELKIPQKEKGGVR